MENTTQARNLGIYTGFDEQKGYDKWENFEKVEPLDYVAGCGDIKIYNGSAIVKPTKLAFLEKNKRDNGVSLSERIETYFKIGEVPKQNDFIFVNNNISGTEVFSDQSYSMLINCNGFLNPKSLQTKWSESSQVTIENMSSSANEYRLATVTGSEVDHIEVGTPNTYILKTDSAGDIKVDAHRHSVPSLTKTYTANLTLNDAYYDAKNNFKNNYFNKAILVNSFKEFEENSKILMYNCNKRLQKYLSKITVSGDNYLFLNGNGILSNSKEYDESVNVSLSSEKDIQLKRSNEQVNNATLEMLCKGDPKNGLDVITSYETNPSAHTLEINKCKESTYSMSKGPSSVSIENASTIKVFNTLQKIEFLPIGTLFFNKDNNQSSEKLNDLKGILQCGNDVFYNYKNTLPYKSQSFTFSFNQENIETTRANASIVSTQKVSIFQKNIFGNVTSIDKFNHSHQCTFPASSIKINVRLNFPLCTVYPYEKLFWD